MDSTNRVFLSALRTLYRMGGAGLRLIGTIIGFLAASAQTNPARDGLNSSIRGGVLNYRTGKLDDGTDPYGWYERD